VATETAHGHCGMNGFAFGSVLVAFDAFGGVYIFVEGDGVDGGVCGGAEKGEAKPNAEAEEVASVIQYRFAKPDTMRKQSHTASNGKMLHD